MHCPTYSHQSTRQAFTLVEILVTITVIGILVGMLAVGVVPAWKRAKEAKIQFEMKQMELSIENFKNHYGFYPPSWVRITNAGGNTPAESVATLLRFLNRISPNHQETSFIPSTSTRRIDAWWDEVGQNIDYGDGDDLVFWLSGLSKNKQFPLTNGALVGDMPNAYDDLTIERDAFYEFKSGQLDIHDKVAHYLQQQGKESSFLYIDSASYGVDTSGSYDGYLSGTTYINPKTFQLITLGLDELSNPAGDVFSVGVESQDNICNFADGRLDKYVNENID